jgi:hypothetical protein
VLGAGEDERVARSRRARRSSSSSDGLELLRDRVDRLRDPDAGAAGARRRSDRRVAQHLAASFAIGAGIVAEKSSVCRFGRQLRQHAPDVGQEAHVEHAVGLVEHEELDPVEVCVGLLQMVEQPPRGGDEDVDAAAKAPLLRPHADAAEDRRAGDRRVRARSLRSSRICAASSRVGVRTSAFVVPRGVISDAGSAAERRRSCRCPWRRRRARRGPRGRGDRVALDRRRLR